MSLSPLGILASSGGGIPGSYELIATAAGTGSSGTITFGSIPSTYQHLQLRIAARTDYAAAFQGLYIAANGVTSGYYDHALNCIGGTTFSGSVGTGSKIKIAEITADSATANIYGTAIIDIFDYANTNKSKTVKGFYGAANIAVGLNSGTFSSSSAITSLTLTNQNSANFKTPSRFSLYGIKGS